MSALSNNNGNRHFVKVIGTKPGSDEIYFTENKKVDGRWINEGKFKSLEGNFKGITFNDKTIKVAGDDKDIKEVNILLSNGGEEYQLTGIMQSGFYRSIVNTIASVPKLGRLKLSVAFNKTGYASCYLVLDGEERPEWALTWAQQSEMIDVTKDKKGKTVATDAEELITKLVELVSKVEVDLTVPEIAATTPEQENGNDFDLPQAGNTPPVVEEGDDDQLPF
ncbi:hypothetical protein N9924_00180 [bacterium]|nr:hypothetical protein [bacterium]